MNSNAGLPSMTNAELLSLGDLLEGALTRLDAAGRFDVSVHVDLALHQLRGTRHAFDALQSDTVQ